MKRFILSLTLALFLGSWAQGALVSTIGGDGLSASKKEELLRPLKDKMVAQILALNPGWNQSDLIINCSNPTESQPGPFYIEIGGNAIKDLSFLKKYHLDYLKVYNTGIRDLNFLKGLKQTEKLSLELEKNEQLEDYRALKEVPLKDFMITGQLSFTDTGIINEKTSNVLLINTGITKLAFGKAENLKGLSLDNNSLLTNIEQIRSMKNLEGLGLEGFSGNLGTLLEDLPKISSFILIRCSVPQIPKLHNKFLTHLWVYECKNGIDFSNLAGKTIETLLLLPISNHDLKSLHNVTVTKSIRIKLRDKLAPESLDGIKINGKLSIRAPKEEFIPPEALTYLKDRHINFTSEILKEEN